MNIKSNTVKELQYFVGKLCTIFTPPINRDFDELRSREHFVVRIKQITTDGIWTQHPYRKTLSFFPMDIVMFMQEEQELDPNNSEDAKVIEAYEKETGEKLTSDVPVQEVKPKENPLAILDEEPASAEPLQEGEGVFVDIDSLSKLAARTKQTADTLANNSLT